MNSDRIKSIQSRIGATVDGFWGPKSIAACQRYFREKMARSGNNWPDSDQASLTRFYGAAGDESKLVNLPVAMLGIKYEGKPVATIRCHEKVAESLLRILTRLKDTHPDILAEYAGCFNNRAMRGGSTPSLHARGAAIDFAPDTNANKQAWPVSADMPIEFLEAFADEGWTSAGVFWGRDAMHNEATRH